jgi:homoserine dehydrogenase
LADVEDVFNAILVKGDAIGDVMFYGRGAGKLPTASAVVGDIIEAAKHPKNSSETIVDNEACATLLDTGNLLYKYYIRLKTKDQAALKNEISQHMPSLDLYISRDRSLSDQLVVITGPITEADLEKIEDRLKKLNSVVDILNLIRISL